MSETVTGWPYDARQDDQLAALRIPVVGSIYPGWKYEVALVITDDDLWGPALRPDEAETAMLVSYLEYRMAWYNPGWQAKMRRRPLDTDSGTNTTILQKRGEGDWCYRRMSWITGPFMVPTRDDEHLTLERLLDKINDLVPEKWQAHKAAWPGAFPVSEG